MLGDLAGEARVDAPLDMHAGQLGELRSRDRGQLASLAAQIGTLDGALRGDRHVLTSGHGHCARGQPSNPRREDRASRGVSRAHADHQAGRRDNPVVGSEHRGT